MPRQDVLIERAERANRRRELVGQQFVRFRCERGGFGANGAEMTEFGVNVICRMWSRVGLRSEPVERTYSRLHFDDN